MVKSNTAIGRPPTGTTAPGRSSTTTSPASSASWGEPSTRGRSLLSVRAFLLFSAAVLAATGIGIGAEAAVGPNIYGPPGARFTSAFPAAPRASALSQGGPIYTGGGGHERLSVWILPDGRPASGWVAYAPLAGTGPVLLPGPVPMAAASLDGQRVELGVSCRPALCWGRLTGLSRRSHGRLVGFAATAEGTSESEVRALLTSVEPLDGTVPVLPRRVGGAG